MENIQDVYDEVESICKEEYQTCTEGQYFYAEETTSEEVKKNILSKMKPEHAKMKFLNIVACIMDINGKVFINML